MINANTNITEWLNFGEVRIISDIEGGEIHTFATKKSETSQYYGKILVAGDLIDSTGNYKDFLPEVSHNISNLIECVTGQQIKYVLGNRDLNKIKVFHLTTLKHTQSPPTRQPLQSLQSSSIQQPPQQPMDYFKMFNEGTIPHGKLKDAYENLKKMFFRSKITFNAEMKHWYTFWSDTLGNRDKKNWKLDVNYNVKPFFKRFEEIFGADNIDGTISAQNLLETIPTELEIIGDPDYKAFIVLYVFRIMLIPPLQQNYNIRDISSLRGLLIKFYNNGHGILYATNKQNNELIVFSHGGLTSNFGQQYFTNLESIINNLYNPLTDAYMLKGGVLESSQTELIKNITNFNTKFKHHISEVEKEILNPLVHNKPSKSMLFLLIISAPFNCNVFSTKLRTPIMCKNLPSSGSVGPVVSGIRELIKNPLRLSDKNLLQIFGHYSVGCGVSISDISDISTPTHRSLLVNLDVTNTYSHTTNTNFINSRAIIVSHNGIMYAYTHINTNKSPFLMNDSKQSLPPTNITIDEALNIDQQHQIQRASQQQIGDSPVNHNEYRKVDPKYIDKGDEPTFNRLYFHGIDTTHRAVFTFNQDRYGPGKFGMKFLLIDITKRVFDIIDSHEFSIQPSISKPNPSSRNTVRLTNR